MNKEIRKLMIKHKLPESIMTLYGLEIERIAEDYNQQQIKLLTIGDVSGSCMGVVEYKDGELNIKSNSAVKD